MISHQIYEKQQICNYLVTYQHLSDDTSLESTDSIVKYIRKVGYVQYDPLDVVGHNPDLVLQSRCNYYQKGDIDNYETAHKLKELIKEHMYFLNIMNYFVFTGGWMYMNEKLLLLSKTLNSRGFQVQVCDNTEQAIAFMQKMIGECISVASIGFGN